MEQIAITAILKAVSGREEQLFEAMQRAIQPSQSEPGCVKYQLHKSLDEEGVFVFYEVWKDEESLKKHIQSDHYKVYREQSEPLIESRNVYRLKMV